MRNSTKEDISSTSAELVYGCTLRLPGKFIAPSNTLDDPGIFVSKLRQWFKEVRPTSTSTHGQKSIFVYKELKTCTHVFLHKDQVKKPLKRPYGRPYKVLERNDKTFTLQLGHGEKKVSIDRVKPAYIEAPSQQQPSHDQLRQTLPPVKNDSDEDVPLGQRTSRFGRIIRLPVRFRT